MVNGYRDDFSHSILHHAESGAFWGGGGMESCS